jgi:hypothetical protein
LITGGRLIAPGVFWLKPGRFSRPKMASKCQGWCGWLDSLGVDWALKIMRIKPTTDDKEALLRLDRKDEALPDPAAALNRGPAGLATRH